MVRIEALGLGTIKPAQQLVEAMPQTRAFVLLFFQGVEQLTNQGVQGRHVVRQGERVWVGKRGRAAKSKVRAHAFLDEHGPG